MPTPIEKSPYPRADIRPPCASLEKNRFSSSNPQDHHLGGLDEGSGSLSLL